MEKRLTADLNVVANSNLEIQLLDGDLNIIQKLDDEPNDVGGLTSAELKAKFDESGNIIKKYINETLIPAVLTDDATEESRKQAEAARVAAEQGRVTAEEVRVSAETARAAAEQARSEAEASRVSAENAREAAETARADETAGIVARATEQANAAAGSASQAAGSEQSAKDAAGTATGAASSASQSAASASGSASQASAAAAAAAQSAASVDGINKTAQSWAVGGTGTRPGEDTDNAKYWAKKAQTVVGGDFATKVEAQGYVTAHNESNAAHSDIRKALEGKAAATHASQHGKDGEDPITPAAIGAASLGADGKVPASQLPETDTYTKDEILKDATAAKFGKDTGAVPDEVLDVLSKSILEGTYPVVDVYAGQNWQKGSATGSVTSVNVHQIIQFVNGMFFSFPTEANAVYGIKSQDGKTWTQFKVPPEVSGAYIGAHKLLYVNGVYYLMATRPTPSVVFYSSADLETWEKVSELTTTYMAYSVFYSVFLQKFIVIEAQGKTYLSDDLITWSNPYSLGGATSSLNSGANGIDGPDGFYIATSVNKTVSVVRLTANSFDTVFSAETSTAAVSDASLIRFKGKYFVYSAFVVMQSDDLRNWETSSPTYLNSTTVTQQIAYSDNCVLIKYSTSTYVALDGLNFESFVNDGVAAQSSSMAYGNGVFVFHNQATVARLLIYYTPDTTFKDEPGLVDVLGNMVNIPLKQIAGAASIEIGTYTGTGATTLTLRTNSKPKFFLIFKSISGRDEYPEYAFGLLPNDISAADYYYFPSIFFSRVSTTTQDGGLRVSALTDNEFTLTSVSHNTAYFLLNVSGKTYRYLLVYKDD